MVWKAQTEDLYRSLAAHADRAARQRFRPGDAKAPSYDRKQVDRLVDQVIDKAAAELGVDGVTADDVKDLVDVNSTSVANVIFTQRKGKRGYDERQVDNYLNACVRLLSRIESYARVSDYVHDPATTQQRSAVAETAAAPALFPPREQTQSLDTAASPTVMDDDFAELHRVEQQIFAVPAPAAPREPAVAPVPPAPAPAPSAPAAETASPVTTAMPAPAPTPEYTAPAAPAPVAWDYARPTEPAAAAQQPEQSTPEKSEDPLSGLAHLAAAVQQTQPMPTASDPQVPSLDVPSVPTVRSLNLDAMPSLDIPDLSFPTFDNDEPTWKKTEQ